MITDIFENEKKKIVGSLDTIEVICFVTQLYEHRMGNTLVSEVGMPDNIGQGGTNNWADVFAISVIFPSD